MVDAVGFGGPGPGVFDFVAVPMAPDVCEPGGLQGGEAVDVPEVSHRAVGGSDAGIKIADKEIGSSRGLGDQDERVEELFHAGAGGGGRVDDTEVQAVGGEVGLEVLAGIVEERNAGASGGEGGFGEDADGVALAVPVSGMVVLEALGLE